VSTAVVIALAGAFEATMIHISDRAFPLRFFARQSSIK